MGPVAANKFAKRLKVVGVPRAAVSLKVKMKKRLDALKNVAGDNEASGRCIGGTAALGSNPRRGRRRPAALSGTEDDVFTSLWDEFPPPSKGFTNAGVSQKKVDADATFMRFQFFQNVCSRRLDGVLIR